MTLTNFFYTAQIVVESGMLRMQLEIWPMTMTVNKRVNVVTTMTVRKRMNVVSCLLP